MKYSPSSADERGDMTDLPKLNGGLISFIIALLALIAGCFVSYLLKPQLNGQLPDPKFVALVLPLIVCAAIAYFKGLWCFAVDYAFCKQGVGVATKWMYVSGVLAVLLFVPCTLLALILALAVLLIIF